MNGYAIGGFFLVLVLACWAFVIPHQLGLLDSFKPPRYSAWEAVLPIAYTGAGLSLCFVSAILAILVAPVKKLNRPSSPKAGRLQYNRRKAKRFRRRCS